MKKVLVVFLILAAAGGLFAQVTVSGGVSGGVGILKVGDDTHWGITDHAAAFDGLRGQVNFSYTNDDKNAGAYVRLRARATSGSSPNTQLTLAYGWLSGLDGMLKVAAGKVPNSEITGVDGYWDGSLFGSTGLYTIINPLPDLLKFGVGASPDFVFSDKKTFDDVTLWGGVGLDLAVLSASAQISHKKKDTNAALSVGILGLPVDLGAAAVFNRLDDFSNVGEIEGYLNVGAGIGDIEVGGALFATKSNEHVDLFLGVDAWASITIGNIVPALSLAFVKGGEVGEGGYAGLCYYTGDPTYDPDQMYLSIEPSVQFQIASNKYFQIGALINKDLGNVIATGGKDKGMNFGAFASVRVNF
jgi:hypothetical protein